MVTEKTHNDASEISANKVHIKGGRAFDFFKRMFDIFFALAALFFLLIPMVIIALLIYLESPGPAIYKHECQCDW